MAQEETLYKNNDNTIDIVLKQKVNSVNVAQDLTNVTGIRIMFDTTTVFSNNSSMGSIQWQVGSADSAWQTGEVRLDCNSLDVEPNRYSCPLVVIDPNHTQGLVWSFLPIDLREEQ